MTNRFQILAVNDKRDFCECCGRNGLVQVVWVLDTETGEEKHFGTTCAMAPAKGFDLKKEIRAAVATRKAQLQGAYARARSAYKAAGHGYINSTHPDGYAVSTCANPEAWEIFKAAEIAKI